MCNTASTSFPKRCCFEMEITLHDSGAGQVLTKWTTDNLRLSPMKCVDPKPMTDTSWAEIQQGVGEGCVEDVFGRGQQGCQKCTTSVHDRSQISLSTSGRKRLWVMGKGS